MPNFPAMDLTFHELIVIESLREKDVATGSALVEHLRASSTFPVPVTLARPRTRNEFALLLRTIAERAERTSWVPLLHLEVHGSPAGFELTSREQVGWLELAALTRRINIATRNALVVILAACDGSWFGISAALNPFRPAPFFGVIAPDDLVNPFLLMHGFRSFYSELAVSRDFLAALRRLQGHSLPEYRLRDTPKLFRDGLASYKAKHVHTPGFRRRVRKVMRRHSRSEIQIRGGWGPARKALVKSLRNPQERLERYWSGFVMSDRFPENAARFPFEMAGA